MNNTEAMKTTIILLSTTMLVLVSCTKSKKTAAYRGEDISHKAFIVRDVETDVPALSVNLDGKWSLLVGTNAENIDFDKPILTGTEKGVHPISDLDKNSYHVFLLETTSGTAILSENRLPMKLGYNFRDLGGIKTSEGRFVKWGKVFRTDELCNLGEHDLDYLASIPITSIIDFRTDDEVRRNPDKHPASMKNTYHLAITAGNLSAKNVETELANPNFRADEFMKELNLQLVSDSATICQYRIFFEILQSEASTPLIFHCTAGKDRTGMGATLFLYSLGVDEEIIFENYLESNQYLADKYRGAIERYPQLEGLFTVKREYLETGIDRIKKDHGSVENYLTKVLKVDLQQMKALYLYPSL